MRIVLTISFALALAVIGCVSNRESRLQQRQAYLAGQQQAITQSQSQTQPQGPFVTVRGPVVTPLIPWTPDLTMNQAIVSAQYTGLMNPRLVRVIRNGSVVQQFLAMDLLKGSDMPLQPGDVIQISP